MADIKNPTLIWLKGILFLILGLFATGLLVFYSPNFVVIMLHCLAVWAFCRFYYFAFYVIQHYVDPSYRFAGLFSFMKYAMAKRRSEGEDAA